MTLDENSILKSDVTKLKYFDQFPLPKPLLASLKSNGFTKPTEIQKLVLQHALAGKDVVVEAATGSGKTLAFLIPLLAQLYSSNVSTLDGPVGVILTPTRELTRQVTMVLKRFISSRFTMLNIMGGKASIPKRQEWACASKANILIGTPGRFAQHQTENPLMDLSNLRVLVLDEADRLLDPTFRSDLDVILDNLTPDRQTLLFSATQTSTIDQLVRLRMRNPVILSTRGVSTGVIPSGLFHSYAVVTVEKKLDILWTFLQSHCKKKIIVFFSTQKQVRFVFELFQQLRPYFRVLQLRGNMQLQRRFQVYDQFAASSTSSVLLATNVAERGLDFPTVDWVVQFDSPRNLDDYIHRVGRTARSGRTGKAITFLLQSELALVDLLHGRQVQPKLQHFPESRVKPVVSNRAPSLLAKKPELASVARSAFSAYVRDYCLGAGQLPEVFQPSLLSLDQLAASFGLPSIPELHKSCHRWFPAVLSESTNNLGTTANVSLAWSQAGGKLLSADDDQPAGLGLEHSDSDDDLLLRKPEYAALSLSAGGPAGTKRRLLDVAVDSSNSGSSGEETTERAPADAADHVVLSAIPKHPRSRIQKAKSELRRQVRTHVKMEFDDDGQVTRKTVGNVSVYDVDNDVGTGQRLDAALERERLRTVVDKADREKWRALRRERNQAQRRKLKQARRAASGQAGALLEAGDGGDDT